MENPDNRQFLDRMEVLSLWRLQKVGNTEYVEKLKEILEYTIPYDTAMSSSSNYLSSNEILCIYNMSFIKDLPEYNFYKRFLEDICYQCEESNDVVNQIRMYELLLLSVASWEGNMENYDESNLMCIKLIKGVLSINTLSYMDEYIYNIAWNMNEERKKEISQITREELIHEYLEHCIAISKFAKRNWNTEWYINAQKRW